MELSVAVEADLAFHQAKWFVPVGRILSHYQEWTVAIAYHGAVYLSERHTVKVNAAAECNQRSSNLQRRCSRMLAKYGLTTAVGSKTPAADLYYAAVAVLIDAGKVAEWVRQRDLRKGYYGKEKCIESFRDPYRQLKLKCTCPWVTAPDDDAAMARPRPIDPHSGLPLELQLEVFRHTRAASIRRRCPTGVCTATTASSRPWLRSCAIRTRQSRPRSRRRL